MARAGVLQEASFHPWAKCQEEGCPREWPMSRSTRELAKTHTKMTGHVVLVVVEKRTLYEREGV